MQAFRDMIKGWVGKAILAVVIVLFVLMGAEALFGVLNAPKPIASVNGDDISQQEFGRGMEMQRRDVMSRMGENADSNLISDELLRESVIERLVGRLLMKQTVSEFDFAISNNQVNKAISEIPSFQRDGRFSQEQFERLVTQSGYGPKQFIEEVGYDLIVAQLKNGLVDSAFATKGELKKLIMIDRQSRDVALLEVNYLDYKALANVDENEIAQYYEENQYKYKTEEVVKVDYITVSVSDFIAETSISEDELRARYDVVLSGLKDQEERKASHILLEISETQTEEVAKEKINDIKAKLNAGADFVELAKDYSDDTGSKDVGGSLEFAGKGVYAKEFEDALFSLDEGQVSEVVQTEFGFHIIRLDEVMQPELPTFAEKKVEIQDYLQTQQAEDIYYEKIDELKDVAFEAGDLEGPADLIGKEIMHSDWLNRTENDGVFESNKIVSALFEDEVLLSGNNTEVLEISRQESIVARVIEHVPANVKPATEVRDEIYETLLVQKATLEATNKGQDIVKKLKDGASASDVEAESGLKWKVISDVKRRSPELGHSLAQHIFKMPKAADAEKTIDGIKTGNNYTVVIVTAVKEGEYNLSNTEEAQLRRYIANQFGQSQFEDYLRNRRENASIAISKPKG
ncbi:MAG: SurA N-terminal domain-containing protein [Pseudomonadales bacterium]|nr:SurA N-terminal domain-containing protein [Pseudomonadales bacterium]